MKTSPKTKKVDAVKIMRNIREKISKDTANMTFEELKEYIRQKLKKNKWRPIGQ